MIGKLFTIDHSRNHYFLKGKKPSKLNSEYSVSSIRYGRTFFDTLTSVIEIGKKYIIDFINKVEKI